MTTTFSTTKRGGSTVYTFKRKITVACHECKDRRFRFELYKDVPNHRFARTCPGCDTVWDIFIKSTEYQDAWLDVISWKRDTVHVQE